jgi:hypothetical protein
MHKIVIVKVEYSTWYDNYDDYNSKISEIIPESEWMEVDDELYKMYIYYCQYHSDYRVLELIEYNSKPKPLTEDAIKEWYTSFLRKQKADEAKRKESEKKALEKREKNAAEKKRKQLEKLAKELGAKIQLDN